MANTLIKDALSGGDGGGGAGGGAGGGGTGGGGAGVIGPTCKRAIQRKVFQVFGGKGYLIQALDGEDGVRWRLDNPMDPYIWYVTGSCSGGQVTLSYSMVQRSPWAARSD